MKTLRIIQATLAALLLFPSCDVHEFPDVPDGRLVFIRLRYETDMTEWNHVYDEYNVVEDGVGETCESVVAHGYMRYVIRAYPKMSKLRTSHAHEFVLFRDVSQGYDCDFTLSLSPDDYDITVWSDLVLHDGDGRFHDVSNFAEILLQCDEYEGNTDYRDSFRGYSEVSLPSGIVEHEPDTLNISMERPLAKYEFITNDLEEFVRKELALLAKDAETRGEQPPTKLDTDKYKVVFSYSGYLPNTYNIHSDRPVDSAMGVMFESELGVLDEHEATMGFDYVFVNGHDSEVSVRIGLYDDSDRQVALTDPINVPLRRSHHTVIRGSFLMQQASGGIVVNPEFDGNHNIVIP